MKNYILFHKNCFDGYGAALAGWMHFKEKREEVVLIPCNYNEKFPLTEEEIKDSVIYVLDFSFPKEELIKANGLAKEIKILDHHQTAEKDLKDLSFAHFDMSQSGAMLAWKYFHPNKPIPKLIEYIQDRDLWTFLLPYSKEVNSSIQSNDLNSDCLYVFESLLNQMEDPSYIDQMKSEGSAILRAQKQAVDLAINRSCLLISLGGYDIPACNSSIYESEIAARLLDKFPNSPFAAAFYYSSNGETINLSLRCKDDFDVSVIAKLYNGGGHKKASGCKVKAKDLIMKKF